MGARGIKTLLYLPAHALLMVTPSPPLPPVLLSLNFPNSTHDFSIILSYVFACVYPFVHARTYLLLHAHMHAHVDTHTHAY